MTHRHYARRHRPGHLTGAITVALGHGLIDTCAYGGESLVIVAQLEEELDHVRGASDAPVILEYGDYEWPYSRQAFRAIERLVRLEQLQPRDVRFAYRHFPLTEIHPHALAATRAAEAAALPPPTCSVCSR